MVDFKYFDYGKPNPELYGLYEPVSDCFLIVYESLEVLLEVKYILSSKYTLFPIRLDQVNNFTTNLIDNSCCENWSFTNNKDISMRHLLFDVKNIYVANSVSKTTNKSNFDIVSEKKWALFCLYWLIFLKKLSSNYSKLDEFLNSFLELSELSGDGALIKDNIKKSILRSLYLGNDINQVEKEIESLIGDINLPPYYAQRHQ